MTYGERSDRVLMPFECGDLIRQRLLSAGATPTAAAPTPFPTAALPTATAECMSAIPRASLTPALPEHVSTRKWCDALYCGGGGRSQPRVRVGRRFFTARLFERYFNSKAMRIGGGEAAQALMLDIHSADSAGPSGHSTHASAVGDSGCTRNACS